MTHGELLPLLRELCYIANTRNEINTRRHRARYRKNYYEKAVAVVRAHQSKGTFIPVLVTENPNPKKWMKMGVMKLRSLALKNQAEYAAAKHETMEFSLKTTRRVKYLTTKLQCRLCYNNGAIDHIRFLDLQHLSDSLEGSRIIDRQSIKRHATKYQVDRAFEEMIKD